MAELLVKLQQLRGLPPALHWFCERNDDGASREELSEPCTEKYQPAIKLEGSINEIHAKIKVENVESHSVELEDADSVNIKLEDSDSGYPTVDDRRRLVTDSLQLFAYNGVDVLPHQAYLKQQIDRQLGKCDICILEYHKAKYRAIQSLRSEYDEDEVSDLSQIYDGLDIDRIKRGLDSATEMLRSTGSKRPSKNVLEHSTMLSIFEAMSCQALLSNPSIMGDHFDEPFVRLTRTTKKLRLTHYVPAATLFLFEADHDRKQWALQTWKAYSSPLTRGDFEFAVRDPLLRNLMVASEPITDMNFISTFWLGVNKIIERLSNELITHSLRAMEIDVIRIALEHLKYPSDGLQHIMQTMKMLLEVASKDYWESMGAISPTTVIEQVFNNPYYDKYVLEAKEEEDYEFSALKCILSWIRPFMASIQLGHQAQACRSLTFQLMDRLQVERFPQYSRIECYRTGLEVLSWTLDNCKHEVMALKPVGRIVASETLEVTSSQIKRILEIATLAPRGSGYSTLTEKCLTVVKTSLALECKSIKMDQATLKEMKEIQPGFCSYSPAIWDAVVSQLNRGNLTLAKAALTGISDLTGLEKFKIKDGESYTKEKSEFNITFGNLTHLVCQMLERINDFNPKDLDSLFRSPETATALVAALFSPDASTYEAGVNLIKSISAESARKEAIGHLLGPFFATTLEGFASSIRQIAENRTFASCPRMLKTCTDVLDILCDSGDGLLRTRALSNLDNLREAEAVQSYWESQWQALRVIYQMTEDWGKSRVADTNLMKEFCRDTMQFSERFFDQYNLFASALDSAVLIENETVAKKTTRDSAGKKLLECPAENMAAMVKWLRLRDTYLATISVKLIGKILERLTEWRMVLSKDASDFLEQVIQNEPQGRTHLTPQEKAELARALETNLGRSISTASRADTVSRNINFSQSSLPDRRFPESSEGPLSSERTIKTGTEATGLAAWNAKPKESRRVVNISDGDEFGTSDNFDEDILSASRSVELLKSQQASRSSLRGSTVQLKSSAVRRPFERTGKDAKFETRDQQSFREKREKEREDKKKRDAEALAIVKKRIADKTAPKRIAGEGSILSGIGLKAKDHTPKGSSMMVSSGSDTNSDDEPDDALFKSVSRPSKISEAVRDYQSNKLRQMREGGPVKKTRQIRSAKDMRARLAPDLTSLHRNILSWDFFHTGDFPPGTQRNDYRLVTNTFRSPIDYQSTFEALLILEAWQGFLQAKEEGSFKQFEIKITSRLSVDSSIELSTIMPTAQKKELGLSEADVVLLSKAQVPSAAASQPHCFARIFKISRKKNPMEVDITYRVNTRNSLSSSMVPNAAIHAARILNLTTLEREYGALLGLQYYDLCDEIIKAKPSPLLKYSESQLAPLLANYSINSAQAKAVRSAVDNDAFTLIQGPPGSGKTKTIVAIIGALMTGTASSKGVLVARPQAGQQRPANLSVAKKLLVCAPSNAAVDELVMRLKDPVKTVTGELRKLSVVRLGRTDAMNANVLDVTLEELVNAKLNLTTKEQHTTPGEDTHKLMMAHKATCEEFNALRIKVDEAKASGKSVSPEQDREFELLKRRKQLLSNQIDSSRDRGDTVARDAEINRRRIQQDILDNAEVICATLSGSGHEMFQSLSIEFETVIIDEAAQSIELSALIPLKYGCSKCILVGDPKQLPPTVLSREAARFQYEQSLFVRMQSNHPNEIHLLDTQYRMHPEISAFPSATFYDGKLLDGPDMVKLRSQPWHESKLLGPYRFFDVRGTHQSAHGHSLVNFAEIEVSLCLFERLTTDCAGYDFNGKIGVITPYKSQLRELRSKFVHKYGETIFNTVEFNTTDAFQGRECEVIIFSCVRASGSRGIGFLSDIRRMNVGITRAKSSLWVLGNAQSLMQGEFWSKLIQDSKARDLYTDGDITGVLSKPLLDLGSKFSAMRMAPKTDNDIEMLDATPSSAGLAVAKLESRALPQFPAGGANGLNSNRNCQICGSNVHYTHTCDNKEAKNIASPEKCHRCDEVGHQQGACTAERCLQCGAFGHTVTFCTSSKRLSVADRDRIRRFERSHVSDMRRLAEKRRQNQLGGHAKSIPTVRATTPPPAPGQLIAKRKREPSPEAMTQVNKNSQFNQGRARVLTNDVSNNNGAQDPRKPRNKHVRNGPPLSESSDTITRTEGGPAPREPPPTPVIHQNQKPEVKVNNSRPPLPMQENVRPPVIKKRKEVNPFIVPKRKKPRPS